MASPYKNIWEYNLLPGFSFNNNFNISVVIASKEMAELRARLDEADRTILLAEERLHEHNIIDENLAAMLAKVKLHSQHELRRFKEEAELSHQNIVSTDFSTLESNLVI